jgi:hypothetical protein
MIPKIFKMQTVTISLIALALISCAKKDSDKIGDAQACLDTSTRANVSQCVEKVSGIETSGAYVIRCAAAFIQEGFDDATRLSTAISNMGSSTGASAINSSISAMGTLAFTSGSTSAINSANAQAAQSYCSKSGSKGLILLASISSFATTVLTYGSTTSITTGLSTAKDNADAQALVGSAVLAAYSSNCTGTVASNQQFCTQFTSVVSNSGSNTSSTCIGKQAMYYYLGSTTTCP